MIGGIIEAVLGIRTKPFNNGLNDAKNQAKKFKHSTQNELSGLEKSFDSLANKIKGIFAATAIFSFFKASSTYAADLADQATAASTSVEKLQAINRAMSELGLSTEDTSKMLITLQEKMADALEGDDSARKAFKQFQISLDEIAASADDPAKMLELLSTRFNTAGNKGILLNSANDLLGKSAKKLGGNLGGLAEGIYAAEAAFIKLTEAQAKSNDEMQEWLGARWRDAKALGGVITAGLWEGSKDIFSGRFFKRSFGGDQWKNNLFGQQASERTQGQSRGATASGEDSRFEGLNEYQKGLVQKFNMDPKQAKLMKPGPVDAQKTDEEKKEAEELHDTIHERNVAESKAEEDLRNAKKRAADEHISHQGRIARITSEMLRIQEQMKGNDDVRKAQLKVQLFDLQQQRKELQIQRNLMSPNERREADRQAGKEKRAASKADRQLDHELNEEARRRRTGARKDEAKKNRNVQREQLDKEGGNKVTEEKLTTIAGLLAEIKGNLQPPH